MYLEALQVRRSQAFGAQGHSGHETFPNVIRLVASGRLDLSPIVTARYGLDATVDAIAKSIERADGKILVKPNQCSPEYRVAGARRLRVQPGTAGDKI
jgi:hypothetical protein